MYIHCVQRLDKRANNLGRISVFSLRQGSWKSGNAILPKWSDIEGRGLDGSDGIHCILHLSSTCHYNLLILSQTTLKVLILYIHRKTRIVKSTYPGLHKIHCYWTDLLICIVILQLPSACHYNLLLPIRFCFSIVNIEKNWRIFAVYPVLIIYVYWMDLFMNGLIYVYKNWPYLEIKS